MVEFMNAPENDKATFRDFLAQPAFAGELDDFVSGGENYDLFSFTDTREFFDFLFTDANWESDKLSLETLADHLEYYARYFREICNLTPDHAITPKQAKDFAKMMADLVEMEKALSEKKHALDWPAESAEHEDAA